MILIFGTPTFLLEKFILFSFFFFDLYLFLEKGFWKTWDNSVLLK